MKEPEMASADERVEIWLQRLQVAEDREAVLREGDVAFGPTESAGYSETVWRRYLDWIARSDRLPRAHRDAKWMRDNCPDEVWVYGLRLDFVAQWGGPPEHREEAATDALLRLPTSERMAAQVIGIATRKVGARARVVGVRRAKAGQWEAAAFFFTLARTILEDAGDMARLMATHMDWAQMLLWSGRSAPALAQVQQARQRLMALEASDAQRGRLEVLHGEALLRQGSPEQALSHADAARSLLVDQPKCEEHRVAAEINRCEAMQQLGRSDDAAVALAQARRLLEGAPAMAVEVELAAAKQPGADRLHHLEAALAAMDGPYPETHWLRALLLARLAEARMGAGQQAAAIAACDAALAMHDAVGCPPHPDFIRARLLAMREPS